MSVFTHPEFNQHEQVSFFHDEKTGLKAVIAVHSTKLGPGLGGCRMWNYDTDEQALKDVLRLSRGMTYKAAITGLPLGGGKSVIIGDARKDKTPDMMRAMGRAVDALGGRYIVAEDVGTTVDDMNLIRRETTHVVGTTEGNPAAAQINGDPSPSTAYGVYVGIKAAVRDRLNKNDLRGLKIAVQGLGSVGYNLCKLLTQDGAQLFVTDIHADRVNLAAQELSAIPVALDAIYDVDAAVFSPCALGGILNDVTIPRLKAQVIAGAANNQLALPRHGDALKAANILYAPDYAINAGGLIHVHYEYLARTSGRAVTQADVTAHVDKIAPTLESVFQHARQENISTSLAADRVAEQRLESCMPSCTVKQKASG